MSANITNHTPKTRRRVERDGGASFPFSARNRAYFLTFAAGAWSSLLLMAGATACARLNAPFAPVVTPHWEAPAPQTATLFSATRAVRALAAQPNGAIWAATEGGVVCWANATASPRVWTTSDGLPSNDVRTVIVKPGDTDNDGTITAVFPTGQMRFSLNGPTLSGTAPEVNAPPAQEKAAPGSSELQTAQARNGQTVLTATTAGLFLTRGKARLPIALPAASRASHVSALLTLPPTSSAKANVFLAGLHGDGLYRLSLSDLAKAAPKWERLSTGESCRFVTALAALPASANRPLQIVIGTRRDGVFVWDGKTAKADTLTALPLPNAFPSGDIYGVTPFQNRLFVSTFDQGVLEVDAAQPQPVRQIHADVREGRALVPFGDKLYVLRADHSVWVFDGASWKPAWPAGTLKRAEVFSLAADERGHRLLIGGWGGWAEWNGRDWQQHWVSPELQNESVTAICADAENAVWLGTQRKGLVRCAGGDTYQAFHEANGLPDDWITCLAVSPQGRLLTGTYTGGMVEWKQNRFAPVFSIDKWAVRTIVFDNERALAATPVGVFREGDPINGALPTWQKIPPQTTGGSEAQTLFVAPRGLWIGTRSGLAYLPR